MRSEGTAHYKMLELTRCGVIHDGFWPVGFCFTNERLLASESKTYVAMKALKPPARIVKLTIVLWWSYVLGVLWVAHWA